MNKRRLISATLAVITSLSLLTACAENAQGGNNGNGNDGNGSESASNGTTPAPSTMGQEEQSKAEEIEVKEFELENKKISFLASWPRNPAKGKNKDVAIELFQSRFGGEIEDITVPDADRYSRLAALISTDDAPDFFSAADMDAFPKGAINHMFQPLDDYIDYNDQWWKDLNSLNDKFVFQGKHYVGAIGTAVDVLMIYNKKVVEANGFEDPAKLLEEGKWDWDTCKKMMQDFCSKNGEGYYATDGWWVSQGFCNSTGVPFVGIEDGKLVNNLNNSLIEQAQELLLDIHRESMAYPVWDNGWTANARNVGLGTTLFFPCGEWALTQLEGEYALSNYADDAADVGFVPVPKCPGADELYIPSRVVGYMLCSGAKNPEGFACYMYCEAAATTSEKSDEITKDQYFNEYGWTEEMWDMWEKIHELSDAHPVFEYYKGVSDEMNDALDNPTKDAYHNEVSWISTRDSIYGSVQAEIDKANGSLE